MGGGGCRTQGGWVSTLQLMRWSERPFLVWVCTLSLLCKPIWISSIFHQTWMRFTLWFYVECESLISTMGVTSQWHAYLMFGLFCMLIEAHVNCWPTTNLADIFLEGAMKFKVWLHAIELQENSPCKVQHIWEILIRAPLQEARNPQVWVEDDHKKENILISFFPMFL